MDRARLNSERERYPTYKRDQKLISARNKNKIERGCRNVVIRNPMANDNWTKLESDFSLFSHLYAGVCGTPIWSDGEHARCLKLKAI